MGDPHKTVPSVNGDPLPFNLTDVDRATLAQTDEEFIPHSWQELKDIVGECHLNPLLPCSFFRADQLSVK